LPGRTASRRQAATATGEGGDPEQRAWSAALAIVARRDVAVEQLRRLLVGKGHPEPAAEAALVRLQRERYLDDASLAARYARSRMEFRGQGQHRVRQGLRRRGVAGATIEEGIREALGEVSEAGVVDRLARRYWTQRRRDAPARRLRGLWAFLVRRGFPPALVHERLRELWPRWSDALEGLEPEAEP
jgi:SOS response regulatory protein OraA/RecX